MSETLLFVSGMVVGAAATILGLTATLITVALLRRKK